MRRMVWLLGVMLVLIWAPSASAAVNRGSIQIRLDAGDLAVTNGALTLYQVGIRVEDGYRLTEGFGGGIVRLEDTTSENLAQWLAESAAESGVTMLLDADGNAVFPDLEEGLYRRTPLSKDAAAGSSLVFLKRPETIFMAIWITRMPMARIMTTGSRSYRAKFPRRLKKLIKGCGISKHFLCKRYYHYSIAIMDRQVFFACS